MSKKNDETEQPQRPMIVYGLVTTAILTAILTIGIYIATAFAEPHIDEMSYLIGERVAELARANAEIENVDEAVSLYRQALTKQFDDPRQRVWAQEEFAEYLIELERLDEAIEIARNAVAEAPDELKSYRLLSNALQRRGNIGEALEVEEARLAAAERLGNDPVVQLAREKVEELRAESRE